MRFLFTLLSVLALSSPLVHATSDAIISDEPFFVGLHESHSHHAKFKVLDVHAETDSSAVPPPQPKVEETGVIRQNDFNPIGSHDVVIEYKSTDDSIKPPWTVSVDAANDLFHYSCLSGSEDSETWTQAMGDVINLDLVRAFFAEYDTYTHPRQIPRIKCTWDGAKIRGQVHLRHLGQRSGDILCTSSSIVDMAKDMARVAGCVV